MLALQGWDLFLVANDYDLIHLEKEKRKREYGYGLSWKLSIFGKNERKNFRTFAIAHWLGSESYEKGYVTYIPMRNPQPLLQCVVDST